MSKDSTNRGNTSKHDSEIVSVVSRRLRILCEKNDMTKYRLSQITGVTQTNLAHYMAGNSAPSLPSLEKIAQAFGLTPAQFLTEDGPMAEQPQSQQSVARLWAELSLEDRDCVSRVIQGLLLAEKARESEEQD